jgi:hypothetical protein
MILDSPYISGSIVIENSLTASNAVFSGNLNITGDITSTEGFTGSLEGTASIALNAISSSHALNADNAVSSSFAATSSFADSFTVAGEIVAQTLNVQQVTSSVVYSSGSNVFGNSLSNTQVFTGSVQITGSLEVDAQVNFKVVEAILFQSPQTFTETFTLPEAYNGMLIGPTTLEGQITVSSGSNLTVI